MRSLTIWHFTFTIFYTYAQKQMFAYQVQRKSSTK